MAVPVRKRAAAPLLLLMIIFVLFFSVSLLMGLPGRDKSGEPVLKFHAKLLGDGRNQEGLQNLQKG